MFSIAHPGQNKVMPDSLSGYKQCAEGFFFLFPNFGDKGKNVSEQQRPQVWEEIPESRDLTALESLCENAPKTQHMAADLPLPLRQGNVCAAWVFFPVSYSEYLLHLMVVGESLRVNWEVFDVPKFFKLSQDFFGICYIPVFVVMKGHLLSF